METEHVNIRQVSPAEALRHVYEQGSRVVLESYQRMPSTEELPLAILSMVPELHAIGIHAERLPDQVGIQFSAFVTLAELRDFWGFTGSDEDFEGLIRDVDGTNILTLHIDGVPTRCVEPFIREVH